MNRLATVALTALAPISWGSTYAVATELLPPDRPLFTGVMRALPAGLLLTLLSRRLPKGEWWWKSAVLGALNIGAFFPLLFLAAYRLPGGVAAVLGSAYRCSSWGSPPWSWASGRACAPYSPPSPEPSASAWWC